MFIETLEFTIPVELCNVFSNLQKGLRSNVEFPASVNSYGTTQDANIQVVLRSNKLTFKVDGVSSNASMISKSECKTLKLSVFDVDHSLMPQEEEEQYDYNNMSGVPQSIHMSGAKRLHEQSVSLPPAKSSRTSYSESPRPRSPLHRRSHQQPSPRPSQNSNSHSKSQSDTPVNVKQEPEDPDLIEIEPDDIVPKKEIPYMQIDYSSNEPHTQTSQAALERLSHPQSSHSQSPASSSSSFHQNVPHVQDYSEPGPSQSHHGDQSADDFLVFQDENDDDNEADYSNDDNHGSWSLSGLSHSFGPQNARLLPFMNPLLLEMSSNVKFGEPRQRSYPCAQCDKIFSNANSRWYHIKCVHERVSLSCVCGKQYSYRPGLLRHQKTCCMYQASKSQPNSGSS